MDWPYILLYDLHKVLLDYNIYPVYMAITKHKTIWFSIKHIQYHSSYDTHACIYACLPYDVTDMLHLGHWVLCARRIWHQTWKMLSSMHYVIDPIVWLTFQSCFILMLLLHNYSLHDGFTSSRTYSYNDIARMDVFNVGIYC